MTTFTTRKELSQGRSPSPPSIEFLITTFNRQKSCQRLVDALQGLGEITVLNDGCNYEIKGCRQVFKRTHGGKRGYWDTVNTLFSIRGKHKYYIMLPDDFLTNREMVEKAVELWEGIKDKRKICLNLYADRIGMTCWTNFQPRDRGLYWQAQWVDMCFICEYLFFDTLGRINGPLRRSISSGVGSYISRKLSKAKYNLYQVKESLITIQPEHYNSQIYGNHTNSTDRNAARKIGGFEIIT